MVNVSTPHNTEGSPICQSPRLGQICRSAIESSAGMVCVCVHVRMYVHMYVCVCVCGEGGVYVCYPSLGHSFKCV